jgi:integral membrane protein (TIGR01906 family)
MKKRMKLMTPGNILVGLIGFLFLFSLAVVIVVHARQIYYFDIAYLRIEEESGLSAEVIRRNYDVLIDYNLVEKQVDELVFPDFSMSDHGRIHFEEVKRIFVAIQYLCLISGILLVIGLADRFRRRNYGSLLLMSIFTLIVPIVLGILAFFWWDTFFIRFHELFFQNNYWLFDPATDPVINILPDEFFFHCAAAILLLMLVGCVVTGGIFHYKNKKLIQEELKNGYEQASTV